MISNTKWFLLYSNKLLYIVFKKSIAIIFLVIAMNDL